MIPQIDPYLADLSQTVALAVKEDVGSGDISAQIVDAAICATAKVVACEAGVVCGRPWFDEVFRQIDSAAQLQWVVEEGEDVKENQLLVVIRGNARSILTAERTALNFLQTLSGTAAKSRQFARATANLNTSVLDTRKTLPGLRLAQKYAVRVGGCENHRLGLYDAFLIKENHIAAAGSIQAAVRKAREIAPQLPVEVETENLDEVTQALVAGADRIMLDNFDAATTKAAVALIGNRAEIEVSGGISMDSLDMDRLRGVDYLSSGALTKDVRALDLSMRVYLEKASD